MSADKPSEAQTAAKTLPKTKAAPPASATNAASAPLGKAPKVAAKPKAAVAQPAARAPVKATPEVDIKPTKIKKPKLVRDSLTMPKAEYDVLDLLKTRAAVLQTHIKKTELIRAGIKALAAMTDAAFLTAIKSVPNLKTGRPKKS